MKYKMQNLNIRSLYQMALQNLEKEGEGQIFSFIDV